MFKQETARDVEQFRSPNNEQFGVPRYDLDIRSKNCKLVIQTIATTQGHHSSSRTQTENNSGTRISGMNL